MSANNDQSSLHDSLTGVYVPAASSSSVPAGSQNPISAAEAADALLQAEHGVDIRDSDDDGGYESDSSAATMSLASSAKEFIYENGRRYHAYRAGAYNFPNDEAEQDREDLKHAMYLKLFNKVLHFAPLNTQEAFNAIDLGTGTGIWAIDCEFVSNGQKTAD
jgi:hypothetical protein